MDYEEFLADDLVQDGVIRNLMVSPGEPLCPSKD
ncbi:MULTISPECIES: hypothetical protein [Methanoculleus]|jgi:uncharacterized protein with HEPN domain|uniref:Uncharacterized protein n=3 Tax=Methanoculleus TaxID=45989 RepID=A3CUP4_METMJ|nr:MULTISPECIES: hypothetical protein [Methanoculleus]ABN57094.1 hypothetical protein Memar_1163 [Methanoculleus marisnigri JR1]UYU18510.1 hypothetical protein OH143_00025 [Methanoculleus submarinus]